MWVVEIIDLVAGHGVRPLGHRAAHRSTGWSACRRRRSCTPGSPTCSPTRSRSSCSATFIALGDVKRFVQVTVIVAVTSGLGTWLFGSPGTIHIGASGLVFGYLTYLVVRGFFAGKPLWVLGGLARARAVRRHPLGPAAPARASRSPATSSAPSAASSPPGTSTAANRPTPTSRPDPSECLSHRSVGAGVRASRHSDGANTRMVRAVGGAAGGRVRRRGRRAGRGRRRTSGRRAAGRSAGRRS